MGYIDNEFKIPRGAYIVVDGSYIHSTGETRYQVILNPSGEKLYESKIYKGGSSNLAEFLAIAEALYWCKENNSKLDIYSDSHTAMTWVQKKKVKTKVVRGEKTKEILDETILFLDWLFENPINNRIIQWKTKLWGENPADFGFK